MKFYYAPHADSFFEVSEDTYYKLNECIETIGSIVDNTTMPVADVLELDPVAREAEATIKSLLTDDQYKQYKSAPIY